jgi:hypothetical protein
VEESSETNFIDLTEIKSKFQSDVLVEVPSSRTIGILITKLFHGVKINLVIARITIIASPFTLSVIFFSLYKTALTLFDC